MVDRVKEHLTLKNAKEWFYSSEKFVFCLTLLGDSLTGNEDIVEPEIEHMEKEFELIMIEQRRLGKI